jgi:hypothetical protein
MVRDTYTAVHSVESQPTFWGNGSPASSRSKNKPSKIPARSMSSAWYLRHGILTYYSTLKMEATCSLKRRLTFNGLHRIIPQKRQVSNEANNSVTSSRSIYRPIIQLYYAVLYHHRLSYISHSYIKPPN